MGDKICSYVKFAGQTSIDAYTVRSGCGSGLESCLCWRLAMMRHLLKPFPRVLTLHTPFSCTAKLMHFHPSRILSGPLRPQSTKPTHPRSFNVVLGTPSQPRTLTTSAKRCLSPAKPEPSRRTTAHTGPGALELRESLQIYTRKQPRMEYNSFRGNAAPGGGNFAMQPSQMPSFYFDTTPGGTSQFHSGPSVPAPTASHGNMQTNQPVSIPTGPAAMTRLPPPNAPTEP